MIEYKTPADIAVMKKGGEILVRVLEEVKKYIHVGTKTADIDKVAERFILKAGGEPGFKKVPGYGFATCICINEQIVHTKPSRRLIQKGDVVTIDCGVFYRGFHTDAAITVQAEPKTEAVTKFLSVGQNALHAAISQAQVGKSIGEISRTIQQEIEGAGYHVVPELTGHGVGSTLHQDPSIPGVLLQKTHKTEPIVEGMTLAIEVIYAMGSPDMVNEKSNTWSLVTKDKSISACFEHTVAILKNKTFILA